MEPDNIFIYKPESRNHVAGGHGGDNSGDHTIYKNNTFPLYHSTRLSQISRSIVQNLLNNSFKKNDHKLQSFNFNLKIYF